ncbi:MAG: hypothetical protein J0H44_13585 [Alphaproteobacteria bacterium]|nr:hypothetical protein [Alphaproteobacteria bacterium]
MPDDKEKEAKADTGKEGSTLDKLLKGIDAATAKLDSMGARMDAFEKRMDDDAKRRADAEKDEKEEEHEEDKREEEEGKPKPVAADGLPSMADDLFDRLAEKRVAIDDAYHGFGMTAPRPLSGEGMVTYRKRALRPLQRYSSQWKDIDLGVLAADEGAFDIAEAQILAAAKEEAREPKMVTAGTLRAIVSRDDAGHTITKFYGKPSVWMSRYMGGNRRYVKRIDPKAHQRD